MSDYSTPATEGEQQFKEEYLKIIEDSLQTAPPVTRDHRKPEYMTEIATFLHDQGIKFFVPVHLNQKKIAWKNDKQIPVRRKTLAKIVHQKKRLKNGTFRRRYDLAVRGGKWMIDERDPDRLLIILDIDDWATVPPHVKAVLMKYPTFVVRTMRGLHFYFWVSKWFSKSGSNPGIADWQARGHIAVLTRADRLVLVTYPMPHLPEKDAQMLYDFATKPSPSVYPRWKGAGQFQANETDGEIFAYKDKRNYPHNHYRKLNRRTV